MTYRNLLLAIISLTVICFSCETSPRLIFNVSRLDTTISAKKISISDLANNYKSYQGEYVETTGRFYAGFEDFAVYTNKNLLTGETNGFWLDLDKDLKIDNASFKKMSGERVTIKGIVDTTSKGHLSSYLATIKNIYYWRQYK